MNILIFLIVAVCLLPAAYNTAVGLVKIAASILLGALALALLYITSMWEGLVTLWRFSSWIVTIIESCGSSAQRLDKRPKAHRPASSQSRQNV